MRIFEPSKQQHSIRMKKNYQKPILYHIPIETLGEGNYGIAHAEGKKIIVDNVAPGDVVDIQILKKKHGIVTGMPLKIHEESPLRTPPFCSHFPVCGGCQWQHINYDTQLATKEKLVKEKLITFAHMPDPPIRPTLGADPTQYYRNKLEYTFSTRRWLTPEEVASQQLFDQPALGFHKKGYFDKVINIQHCYLQEDPSNAIRMAIDQFARENDITFYDVRNHTGALRNLIIRTFSTKEVMVIVQFGYAQEGEITQLMAFIKAQFPCLTSLQYVVNTKLNETFHDLPVHCYAGKPFITEEIDGLRWQIGPKSFFQTNSMQAKVLYRTVAQLADLQGDELVWDLYTGVGTIAHYLAKHANHVIGIELVENAIADAKENALLNNIHNVSFYAGDMKDTLQQPYVRDHGAPQLIVADPPRAGMHPDVIQQLLEVAAERIIYVSCNPTTQAKDISLLASKYALQAAQPIDMFPHTSHVENVALLVKR